MYKPANLKRNLALGSYAPLTIKAADSIGATARAIDELHLSRLNLAGVDATPEQLIDLAQTPAAPEHPDRGELPFGTTWEYLDSQDAQDAYSEPNEDERTIEYEDYREGLADRYLRPDFVDWRRERE